MSECERGGESERERETKGDKVEKEGVSLH